MEFLHESVALGVDLLIFGLCAREYVHYKRTAKVLKVRIEILMHVISGVY